MLQYVYIILGIFTVITKCELALDNYDYHPSTGNYSFVRYHIDKKSLVCVKHIFKGVSPNFNSFPTLEGCEKHLRFTPKEQLESCHKPKQAGSCEGSLSRWYFDQQQNKCIKFIYTGCGGNGNVFESFEDCENACKPTNTPNNFDCKVEPFIGDKNISIAIVADVKNSRCISASVGSKTTRGTFRSVSECVGRSTDLRVKACRSKPYQPKAGDTENKEITLRYYFNQGNQMCEPFYSSQKTFDPLENNFPSLILCQSYCGGDDFYKNTPIKNICDLPLKNGTGELSLVRYYFDGKKCTSFNYGGIGGNENNFEFRDLCSVVCK